MSRIIKPSGRHYFLLPISSSSSGHGLPRFCRSLTRMKQTSSTPPPQLPMRAAELRELISKTESDLARLKAGLARVEAVGEKAKSEADDAEVDGWKWPLRAQEYDRYGRQLILPNFGIHGQTRLQASRILIVGAGGLGCPAAAYLAGAGVGTLGLVDGDVVEPSNLHRQIAHGTSRVGMLKVDSLVAYCRELNPLPTYIPHRSHLTPDNAEAIVKDYDLVLDCTDHPTSRYLISDICVLLGKPLVSASALRTDGQLIVLNTPPTPQAVLPTTATTTTTTTTTTSASPTNAPATAPPCYRCVFPKPPPSESVVSCGEGGILGPVVGVMGVLQALEAIKIIAAGLHLPPPPNTNITTMTMAPSTLLLFSGAAPGAPMFRSVKMRSRRKDCFACAGDGRLTLATLRSGSLDYVAFCGGSSLPVRVLDEAKRVSPREYRAKVIGEEGDHAHKKRHLLLDVREKELFDVASVDGAVNVPYSKIQSAARRAGAGAGEGDGSPSLPDWIPQDLATDAPIYVVCRVGNDSQLVAKQLIDLGLGRNGERWIGDIKGGMRAWRDQVDSTLPFL